MRYSGLQHEIYDARLRSFDQCARIATFEADGVSHCVGSIDEIWWRVGTIGRLRLPSERSSFGFLAYPDQRLRRRPADDDPLRNLWGWQIDATHFASKAGVVPGRDGLVVAEDTDALVLEIPRELINFCGAFKLLPETVLRGFVADLCALVSSRDCPREDGYSSTGGEGRRFAHAYFRVAYPWLEDRRSDSKRPSHHPGTD